jgi:twitching motility protein PilU
MYLDRLFKLMAEKQASDLFITCGAPINIKVNGVVAPISTQPMDVETVRRIAYELMSKEQAREFENEMEMNLSHLDRAVGNFRINIFRQRGTISLVIRFVRSNVPAFEQLNLPPVLLDLVMEKRGLVLICGATGSGKSTTLAAMIDHRNASKSGHILTLEDPIEYLFEHRKSLVNQREIGVDTQNYQKALANALREAPDLIMIGEIRDRETMQQALLHTLTGHLCLATLHANNSYHAMSRIINLFPYDARSGLLSDLSIGLRAIVCQRLVRNKNGEQQPAVEILLNTALIAELIKNGEITQIKEAMEQSLYPGSQTFEQALCRLHMDGVLTYDEAMTASDSPTNLAWLINQQAPTARVDNMGPQGNDASGAPRPASQGTDFASLRIDAGLLDRTH